MIKNNQTNTSMSQERYRKGAHTVTELKYHFVWKTKYGFDVLRGEVGTRLREIIRIICSELKINIINGNVRSNHVHILISAPTHFSPAKIAQMLKGRSSHRLLMEFSQLRKRYWGNHFWARGYFCSTVGAVTEEHVAAYVSGQDDSPDTFKVWDEPPLEQDSGVTLQSDSSETKRL